MPRPPTPSHCPPGPAVTRPHLSATARASPAPHRPPLSRGSTAACARQPGADASCPSHSPTAPKPPLLSRSHPPHSAHPRTPCLPLFPSAARPSAFKRRQSPSALLSAPLLHTHAQAHRHLPRPSQNWLIDLKRQGLASPPLISPETPLPSAFIGGPLATPQSRPP
jgi:hypothetical protein